MSETIKTDSTIDITDVVCPITFVKVKLALEDLEDGQTLAVPQRRRAHPERAAQPQRRGPQGPFCQEARGRHV